MDKRSKDNPWKLKTPQALQNMKCISMKKTGLKSSFVP